MLDNCPFAKNLREAFEGAKWTVDPVREDAWLRGAGIQFDSGPNTDDLASKVYSLLQQLYQPVTRYVGDPHCGEKGFRVWSIFTKDEWPEPLSPPPYQKGVEEFVSRARMPPGLYCDEKDGRLN
jgi:hypothetical protein